MTVKYKCTVKFSEYEHLTDELIGKAIAAVRAARYDCYVDADGLEIDGECEVDGNPYDADEVASEIRWVLWDSAEIDADVHAECTDEYDWHNSPFAEQMREFYAGL